MAKIELQLKDEGYLMMLSVTILDADMLGVTSRSGRKIKKSTKLMDFTSPDSIETIKTKEARRASRKLNMVRVVYEVE